MNDNVPIWEESTGLEGRYANCFKIGYNAFEFMIDFGQMSDENNRARLHSRMIANPQSVKALWIILQQSLEEYERTFGAIREETEH